MALDALIDRKPPSKWRILLEAPALTLARMMVTKRNEFIASHSEMESRPDKIRVVCISDTHNTTPVLPPGDLLVHAGDLTQNGTLEEMQRQLDWLDQQRYEHKVVVAGNHDLCLDPLRATQNDRSSLSWGSITYLKDSSARLRFRGGRTILIHGNPWTRKHGNWAFQYAPSVDKFYGQLEDDVDILITHSPPKHHLDLDGLGDSFLLQELWRIRPKLHVFGHIHAGYGRQQLYYDRFDHIYEKICAGAGLLRAMEMVLVFLVWMFSLRKTECNMKCTTLVNASIAGGFRDELVRRPYFVDI